MTGWLGQHDGRQHLVLSLTRAELVLLDAALAGVQPEDRTLRAFWEIVRAARLKVLAQTLTGA